MMININPLDYNKMIYKLVYNYWMAFKRRRYEYQDVVQIGYLGLLKAAKTYNKELSSFATYAWFTIEKQFQTYLRDDKFLQAKNREERYKGNFMYPASLNVLKKDLEGEIELLDCIKGDEDIKINGFLIADCVNRLEEDERKVIILKYYKNFSQRKIAEIFNTYQPRISRLEQRALKNLKEMLEG